MAVRRGWLSSVLESDPNLRPVGTAAYSPAPDAARKTRQQEEHPPPRRSGCRGAHPRGAFRGSMPAKRIDRFMPSVPRLGEVLWLR